MQWKKVKLISDSGASVVFVLPYDTHDRRSHEEPLQMHLNSPQTENGFFYYLFISKSYDNKMIQL